MVASSERNDPPGWWRAALLVPAGLVVGGVLLTAGRLPAVDPTVWLETALIAVSTVLLVAVACWLITRAAVPDRRIVLTWGLGSGTVLGLLWMSEIAFNNLAPHAVATPAARGVLDNLTWAIVGGVTMAAAARVTLRTGRLRCGIRTGAWSGLASGLGAAAGGALLLAFLRAFVQSDPLMIDEWRQQGSGLELAAYVTRETLAGVWGHLWVLGIVQGAVLAAVAAGATAAAAGPGRPPAESPR